jgi:hypothetical protein
VLRTAARVAARASRHSTVATGQSPAYSALSISYIARRQSHGDVTSHAHTAAPAAAHSKPVGSWPVLNTAKRVEARIANCSIASNNSSSGVLQNAVALCASAAAARKGLKPLPAAAAAAACRSPAATEGGWPALHTAARCCARGSSSCTMGGSAAPGASGRMCAACRKRMQLQETAEQQLLQQRCAQRQQEVAVVAAGVAVAQSEPGACGVRAEAASGASRWHYW